LAKAPTVKISLQVMCSEMTYKHGNCFHYTIYDV